MNPNYSPYNNKACIINKKSCKCNEILSIEELHNLVLSDYTANPVFIKTWIIFKGCIDQYDKMHEIVKTKNCKEMLIDFYKKSYLMTKEMQTKLKEYFSFDKNKECIIKCNVNDLIDKFLVINISHINTLN